MVDTDKFASLTNEEYYALTGTLTPARIEELLDAGKAAGHLKGIKPWLDEAEACYPEEGFLGGVVTDLLSIITVTKGVRKGQLEVLLNQIQDIAMSTFHDSEYGLEQLKSIRSLLHD